MNEQLPPPVQMMQMITGFWTSCCIYTATKLGIADLIDTEPQSIGQLAEAAHCMPAPLYRLLRALASVGIFSEDAGGRFTHTPLSATLKSDIPGSMKAMAIAQLGDHYSAWGNLVYSIKTGNIAFDKVEGMPVWKFYETHPEEGLNFIKAMAGLTGAAIMNVVPAYDFSQFGLIADIGGGHGALIGAILKTAPAAKGIVYDQEYVAAEAEKELAASEFGGRITAVGGDFFESVPSGADAYLMKLVLHDWDDEKSLHILKNCAAAMKPSAKLLVIESVIPEGNTPHSGKFMDINMLAMTGGKERTEKEFSRLFDGAGLKLQKVVHTHSPMFSILEVVKR